MSGHIVKIKEDATVGEAAHILLRFQINGVLIVDEKDENKISGILTTTDLIRSLDKVLSAKRGKIAKLEKMAKLPALSIASKEVLKIQKDTKLFKLLELIHKKHIYTIPVFDKDKLVGVVGRHDILNVAFGS